MCVCVCVHDGLIVVCAEISQNTKAISTTLMPCFAQVM